MQPRQSRPRTTVSTGEQAYSLITRGSPRDFSLVASACTLHRDMVVAAVTGTNGKTTVHWLLSELLTRLGARAMRIGTLGVSIGGRTLSTGLTSPDPITLHRVIALGRDMGFSAVCLEASSHALHQDRLAGLSLDLGIFTNLSHDHLDYHQTLEQYFEAKCRLFDLISESARPDASAIVNADDSYGRRLIHRLRAQNLPLLCFGTSPASDIYLESFQQSSLGLDLTLRYEGQAYRITSTMIGQYNGMNLAAAFAAAVRLGYDPLLVATNLAEITFPPGRLERVVARDISVFVDYAHTPDAVANALQAVRQVTQCRLWVIVGCGGDRDRLKRAPMLAAAIEFADRVIVTSDNPRSEDPGAIIDEMLSGGAPYRVEPDRRAAIQGAIGEMKPGDVLLIAGKGHETYQVVGSTSAPFSDQEEARRAEESARRDSAPLDARTC